MVKLADHQVVGVEAVLNWQHPELGLLTEDQCTQAPERTGLVHDVGQRLLLAAAQQAAVWRERLGDRVPPVVVNLMPSQAQDPDLVSMIRGSQGLPVRAWWMASMARMP